MMEWTRQIYWNVGHGVVLPMYVFALLAVAALGYGFARRIRVYRQGRPLQRRDDFGERVRNFLKDALMQLQVLKVRGPGLAHAIFFWSFLTLFAGTLLVMLQADFMAPLFGIHFLQGPFYLGFSLILDIAGLLAILMLLGLLWRRVVVRPEGLENGRDDLIAYGLLLAILVTGFLVEGVRMAVTEVPARPFLAQWSPVGRLVAEVLAGGDPATLRRWHEGLWWGHFALVMAFFVAIPLTKLRHLFTTPVNYLFRDRRPKGNIVTLDLEQEDAESFGIAKVAEFTWKDLYDADACTLCKRCQDRCPAYATGKPLSPMKVVNQIGAAAFDNPDADLIATITPDVLWACTTCRACQEICPATIEHVNKILEMRRHMVLMEGEFPGEEVTTAANNLEVNGNPLGLAFAARGDWAEGLPVVTLAEDADVDILYFPGCYASYDRRNIKVAQSFLRLCAAAGIKVGILGKEEKCCGEPVRKLGNEYLYQMVAQENISLVDGYGVKKIVTTCPHCFNTLGRDYRDLGLEAEVEHHTVFLQRLLEEGRLELESNEPFACTYHDSCYIGRYQDIYEEPRALVAAAGGTIAEMARSRQESFCCGAGGGRILAEEKTGTRISETRVKMAAETGAGTLVANCPFCLTMFEDGIKGAELEGQLVVRDLAELLAERLALKS